MENNSPSHKLVKNTGYFTIALVIQKVISFTYFSYLATQIGSTKTGQYFFAISFVTIFSVFLDFGLSSLITREIAKAKETIQKLISNVIAIKLSTSVIILIAIYTAINLLNYSLDVKNLVYLSSITMLIDTFTLTFWAIIRGKHNLKFESIASVLFQIIVLTLGYITLQYTHDPFLLLIVLLIASSFNLIFSASILRFKYKIALRPKLDKKFAKELLIIAWPFALAAIFMRISGSIDSVFLSKFSGDQAVGYYSLPYKITFAFQFIPLAFVASLYPAFTHFFNYEPEKLKNVFNKSLIYLSVLSIPIAIGIAIISKTIILNVYQEQYAPSILTLQILICNLPLIFLTFPMGALLNAANLQKTHTRNIGLMMIVSIITNLIFIPLYSHTGAALASILATACYLILNTISSNKVVKFNTKMIVSSLFRVILACSIMAFSLIFLKERIHWLFNIFLSGSFYIIMTFVLKILTKEDLAFVKQIFKK
jgi:O-antigen/teichoic acid export membrane protein